MQQNAQVDGFNTGYYYHHSYKISSGINFVIKGFELMALLCLRVDLCLMFLID